ncbi:hypothetical protein Tco_1207785 [Tanacetum coccineum]
MKGQEIAQPEISGRVRVQPLSIDIEYSATYRANFDSRETALRAQRDSSDCVKCNLKPDTEAPEHYFKFIAYNEVESMADGNGAPLTGTSSQTSSDQIHSAPLALLQSNMIELMRIYKSLVQLMRERHHSNKIRLVHEVGVLWKQVFQVYR